MTKYGNHKVTLDGIKFDSKAEARRWCELKILERAKEITELERQVMFVLAPSVKYDGEARAKPALRYVLDFQYFNQRTQKWVYEDVKGTVTEGFQIKRHLMKHVHNIDVKVVR